MTDSPLAPAPDAAAFRLAFVPGVTPSKWVRTWEQRLPDVPLTLVQVTSGEAFGMLREGGADAALLRLPVDGEDLSAIPLYEETSVVVVPKDHHLAAAEELTPEDLAEELVLHPLDDALGWEGSPPGLPAFQRPETTADAIELVAAGVGVLVVPQSLARLHHRKDLTYRTMTGVPQSRVALSWPKAEEAPDLVEEFIGIVRGRTVNSTRGRRAEERKGQKTAQRSDQKSGQKPAKRTAGAKPARPGKPAKGKGGAAGRGGKPRRGR
ncbi:LysR family transcriptional regulator substrate-binding protein [Streptomyces sp. NPDC047974]|uniref:LysR family transcriptional regulator substrate-binding protein n=1 Tax=Streptomyces sp. NPDC047974 TaxID=3154343 RepID=UPI0033F09E04